MDDLRSEKNKLADAAVSAIAVSAKLCKKYLAEDDAANSIEELEECVKEYCIADIKSKTFHQALQNTESYYRSPENDLYLPVQAVFKDKKKALEEPITDDMIRNHRYMKEFESISGDDTKTNADKSIVIGDYVQLVDPISKTAIRNPVRNVMCGHLYENDTIRCAIANKNTRCPYIGCPAMGYIQPDHLVFDEELKQKIDALHNV